MYKKKKNIQKKIYRNAYLGKSYISLLLNMVIHIAIWNIPILYLKAVLKSFKSI